MTISIFLAIGETWEEFENIGQDKLFIQDKLKPYSSAFSKVYLFSYGKTQKQILPNVHLISNKHTIPRFLYALLMPIIHKNTIKSSAVIRGMQLSGGIPALISKFLYKKKIVINYGYDYTKFALVEKKPFRSILYLILEKIIIPKCDHVIATTKNLKQRIHKLNQNIVFIPNSIDINLFKPKLNQNTASTQVLFVGRLEKQKNLSLLIKAVSLLKNNSIQLLFVGKGSLKSKLITQAKYLHVPLKIVDSISHDKLPKVYAKADMFVLPSLIEGHPKALLEAMASGLAVIGTNVSGINDIIAHKQNGLLSSLSHKSLSKNINALISNHHLRNKLGKNARKTIVNNFSASILRQKEVSLLKHLANKNER